MQSQTLARGSIHLQVRLRSLAGRDDVSPPVCIAPPNLDWARGSRRVPPTRSGVPVQSEPFLTASSWIVLLSGSAVSAQPPGARLSVQRRASTSVRYTVFDE